MKTNKGSEERKRKIVYLAIQRREIRKLQRVWMQRLGAKTCFKTAVLCRDATREKRDGARTKAKKGIVQEKALAKKSTMRAERRD